MKNFASTYDIKNLFIPVSFEIDKKSLKKFIKTSLELNKINHKTSDKTYAFYLTESKQYQILVYSNEFTNNIFEIFKLNSSSITQEYAFDLYVCKDFFTIYKDNCFYCYQELKQDFTQDELRTYIKNTLKVDIENIYEINTKKIDYLRNEFKNIDLESNFINVNRNTKEGFLVYIIYLFLLVGSVQIYREYKAYEVNEHSSNNIDRNKLEYKESLNKLRYKPFYKNYESLISNIKKHKIKLISMSYEDKIIKLSISSIKKDKLFDFLNLYKNQISSNLISFDKIKKLYKCTTDVKIYR